MVKAKRQKVSKCYENDCRSKFRLKLTLFVFLDQINNEKGISELKKTKTAIELYIFKLKAHSQA